MRVLVDRRGTLPLLSSFTTALLSVLRNQEVAALIGIRMPSALFTAGLPQLGPFLSRGNDTGDPAYRVVGW